MSSIQEIIFTDPVQHVQLVPALPNPGQVVKYIEVKKMETFEEFVIFQYLRLIGSSLVYS